MIISIPEFNKVILAAAAAGLDGVLPPKTEDHKALSSEETLGGFLYSVGDLAADKRMDQQEYRFYVSEATKQGVSEDDLKVLNFGREVLEKK